MSGTHMWHATSKFGEGSPASFEVMNPNFVSAKEFRIHDISFPQFIEDVAVDSNDEFLIRYTYPNYGGLPSQESDTEYTFKVKIPAGVYDDIDVLVEMLNLIMSRGVWQTTAVPNPSTTNTGLIFISSNDTFNPIAPTATLNGALLRRVQCAEYKPYEDFTTTTTLKNIKGRKLKFWLERLVDYGVANSYTDEFGTTGADANSLAFYIDAGTANHTTLKPANELLGFIGANEQSLFVSSVTTVSGVRYSTFIAPSYYNKNQFPYAYLCSKSLYKSRGSHQSKVRFHDNGITEGLMPIPIMVKPGAMVQYEFPEIWVPYKHIGGPIDFQLKSEDDKLISMQHNAPVTINVLFR